MKTLRERKGLQKARRMIAKRMKDLTEWCRKEGCHVAVCVVDAAGKDVPGDEDNVSRTFGPTAGAGIDASCQIIERCLAYVPPDHFVQVINILREFIDKQEKEYWEKVDELPTGGDPSDDDGLGG